MSSARHETIRKQQALRGAGTWNLCALRSVGLCPSASSLPSRRACPALPSSCPFGAELGTETPHAGKTLLPLCARGGDLADPASLYTRRALAGRSDFLPYSHPARLVS
jgi:hypothetical protein